MTAEGAGYVLLGRRGDAGFTLLSEGPANGSRAVVVFGDATSAETFRVAERLGDDPPVVADTARGVSEFLGGAAMGGARYVALDPPTALTRGREEARLVPISAFLDHLLSE